MNRVPFNRTAKVPYGAYDLYMKAANAREIDELLDSNRRRRKSQATGRPTDVSFSIRSLDPKTIMICGRCQ